MAYTMDLLLELAINSGASDLHINPGENPTLRVDGHMVPVEGQPLTPQDTETLLRSILPSGFNERLKTEGAADFGISVSGKSHFRVNGYKTMGNYAMVLRLIPVKIRSLSEIGFPTKIDHIIFRPRGLILVTGPTGSGKSTTLAAMIDAINKAEDGHIITLEDPIEFRYQHNRSLISQRQVGQDVQNFAMGIRHALREDPDIILVGEMRDLETIETAISAAETGHLVFSTLHTTGAARTIDRIIDAFPTGAKEYVRVQLSMNLVAVISQVLCCKKEVGRVAAFEIMVRTDAIGALIREGKTFRLLSELQTGRKEGMITLDAHLAQLVSEDIITKEEALSYTQYPNDFDKLLAIA